MSDGNKNNNGVHEVGTEETRLAYQNDTPGQQVERYLNTINQVIEEKKEKQKKAFTKVFDTPLKGFPYNEQNDAKSIAKMTGTREKAVQQFIDSNDIQGEKLLQKIKKDKKLAKDFAMALSGKPGNKMMKQFTEETVSEAMKIKDIFKKHKRELTKAYKTGDLSFSGSAGKKAEYDLTTWAMDNNEIKTDDPDEFFDWLSRDLEDIVKGKIREETITEAKNLMPEVQKIVDTKGAAKVGGVMLDMFTASVLTQAYAKVNDANKKKMESSNIQSLVKLAQRVMGLKEETTLTEGMSKLLSPAQQAGVLKKWNEPEDSTFAKEVYSNAKIANKKDFIVTSHPVKDGDYYLSLLGNKKEGELDNELVKANTNMNADIRKICAKWSKSKDKGYNPAEMAYLEIEKELCDKKYNNFAAADTMVRDVVWGMVEDLMKMKIKTA